MLLREILEAEEIKILSEDEAKEGHTITIRTPFIVMDKKTKNDRTYSKALMTREVKKVQSAVESGAFLGMGDHPFSGMGNIESTSHIVRKLELDNEKNMGFAELKILDTPKGKIVKTIIREGGKVGVSMRGFGDVINGRVQNNYILKGLDIVVDPSVSAALFGKENILESLDFEGTEKSAPSETAIQEFLELNFQTFQANRPEHAEVMMFDEWKEKYGNAAKAVLLVDLYHIYPDIETALEAIDPDAVKKLKAEEERHHYTDSDCYVEARLMGVSPKEMAAKLNLAEEKKAINKEYKWGEQAAKNLIAEAERSGTNLSDPEERRKFLASMAESQAPTSELTINERSLVIQKRLLSEGKKADDLEFIKKVLVFDDKKAEIKKRQKKIAEQIDREMTQSGAHLSREEYKRLVNREFKRANLPLILEDE